MSGSEVTHQDQSEIFRGTAPFTLTMLAVLGLLMVFPQISLVLLK